LLGSRAAVVAVGAGVLVAVGVALAAVVGAAVGFDGVAERAGVGL
jgi:hypothetical protein